MKKNALLLIISSFLATGAFLAGCENKNSSQTQSVPGEKGEPGEDGKGIVSIELTSSHDNVDTYTITYSDNTTYTYTVTNGIDGQQGGLGPQGQTGATGAQGVQGEEGKSAYEIAVENGFQGTETEWLESLKGQDGEPGAEGSQGPQGISGVDGTSILTGNGEPNADLGKNGDSYINLENWNYYSKEQGVWVFKGCLKGEKGNSGSNGISVVSIEKTGNEGLVDTYTITYSNNETDTFTVTNGANGSNGINGTSGADGHTPVITIGSNGNWFIDGVDSHQAAQGAQGAKGDTGVSIANAYINSDGDLICELSNNTIVNAGNVVLPDETCTVNFDSTGGSPVSGVQITKGDLLEKPTDPSKANYIFDGWFTSDNEQWVFKGCCVYEDMTLYAHWKSNSYSVIYHLNGGTNNPENPDEYFYGTDTIHLLEASKENCNFIGWFSNYELTDECDTITSTTSGTLHFYAKYEEISYTFSFITNGGTEIDNVVGNAGSQFPAVATTRDGYTFMGWFRDNTLQVPYSIPEVMPSYNMTLYAKWEQRTVQVSVSEMNNNSYYAVSPTTTPEDGVYGTSSGSFHAYAGQRIYALYKSGNYWTTHPCTLRYNAAKATVKWSSGTNSRPTIRQYDSQNILICTETLSW